MNTNLQVSTTADRDWSDLKVLIQRYLDEAGPNGATDIMHLVKEWMNDAAISLPDNEEKEEAFIDYSIAVEVMEACMSGLDLKYGLENYRTAHDQRVEALKMFKFFVDKLRA